jgi:hypothetical protein
MGTSKAVKRQRFNENIMAKDRTSTAPIGREDPKKIWDLVNEKYPPKKDPDPIIDPIIETNKTVKEGKVPGENDTAGDWMQMKSGLWYNKVTDTYHVSRGGKEVPHPDERDNPDNPIDYRHPPPKRTPDPRELVPTPQHIPEGLNVWEFAEYMKNWENEHLGNDIADPTVTMPDGPRYITDPQQGPKIVGSGNKAPQGTQVDNQRAFQPFGPGSDPLGFFSGPKGYGNMQSAQASALRNG